MIRLSTLLETHKAVLQRPRGEKKHLRSLLTFQGRVLILIFLSFFFLFFPRKCRLGEDILTNADLSSLCLKFVHPWDSPDRARSPGESCRRVGGHRAPRSFRLFPCLSGAALRTPRRLIQRDADKQRGAAAFANGGLGAGRSSCCISDILKRGCDPSFVNEETEAQRGWRLVPGHTSAKNKK